jgi:hypothetical protein
MIYSLAAQILHQDVERLQSVAANAKPNGILGRILDTDNVWNRVEHDLLVVYDGVGVLPQGFYHVSLLVELVHRCLALG